MSARMPRYLSQSVDYLGFLETKLRDLRGIATLVYELVQNADDVKDEHGQPGASRICFDIRDDALIVENDGVFREIDFERMRKVAGGAKREEEGTTGAFGIGFIAVYQVTDHPELFSSGRHWIFRPEKPEAERIEERQVDTEGTRFRLPWAFDPDSEVRRKLRIEAVRPEQLDQFQNEMAEALSLAALFLKQLKVLELKRRGKLIKRIEREVVEDGQILIQEDERLLIWHIFRGSFKPEADRLRRQYRQQIEAKRRSDVLVAIPDESLKTGRLFAVLPTETTVPLPFHINADFFPSSDRKRIIFGSDYQSEWNRAAIRAAARALAAEFDKLPELLGHQRLWQLLAELDECKRRAEQGEYDRVFADFWNEVAPGLHTRRIVFTTKEKWVIPSEARLLKSKAEEAASPILEALGISVVHRDLRTYFGLLRQKEIGTPLLSVRDVAQALKDAGLNKPIPLGEAPPCLRTLEAWQTLWRSLDSLLEKSQTPEGREEAEEALRSCSIALSTDMMLCPPDSLFRGDAETRELFRDVQWLKDIGDTPHVLEQLVPEFTAKDAVEYLSKHPIETAWRKGALDIAALYRWFESRKGEIRLDPGLKEKLRSLPIWPASGRLYPLTDLYIPGGFDDPLGVSMLIDVKALGGRKDFLKELGVQELTFAAYVREQVPRTIEQNPDLPPDSRRRLVRLLAQELSKIRSLEDAEELQARLARLPLVECTDGHFRPAVEVYAHTEVAKTLGSRVHIAAPVEENTEAVEELYKWLGVAKHPRPKDVIRRIEELTANPPDDDARRAVEVIFEYLADEWQKWDENRRQQYTSLQKMAWLPGNRDTARWYRPDELYTVLEKSLFETQATFLNFPQALQRRAATAGLMEFLGIKTEPTPRLVVEHLLACSEQDKPVNKKVYRFLNDHVDDPALDRLKDTACLLLPNGPYVRPDQVFWGEHPFGRFRYRLGPELRQYSALFERLGVREKPEDEDFIQVLLEIGRQFGEHNARLDDEAYAVVMRCWEELSTALEEERLTPSDLQRLCGQKVIPDPRRILTKPEYIFFEDRADLAAKFRGFLENSAIKRPPGAWRAMEAVGVRRLSEAVELHLLECEDPTDDVVLSRRVDERRELIERVVESEKASGVEGIDTAILDCLQFKKVGNLVIQYSLEAFRQKRHTDPEEAHALWVRDEATLYTVHRNGPIPWPAVARELAFAIKPHGEIGSLASGLKEALAGDYFEEASRTLDELGYPPVQKRPEVEVESPRPIGELGGEELSPEEAIDAIPGGRGKERTPLPDILPEVPARALGPGDNKQRGSKPAGDESPATVRKDDGGGAPRKRESRGRLRTYLVPEGEELERNSDVERAAHRAEVDRAGIARVMEYERAHGRTPTEMPHYHEGYDIESRDPEGNVRYIEVKSLAGDWDARTPAALTRAQFEAARKMGEQFWLYVVERATGDDYRIHPIQNPAGRVNEYLFDDGWQALVEDTEIR